MIVFIIKKFYKQNISIYKNSDVPVGIYRKVILTDCEGNVDYDITLTGGDARLPLEVGQHVLADLRFDSIKIDGEWKDEYYVNSIIPIEKNAKVEFIDDWTTHLV